MKWWNEMTHGFARFSHAFLDAFPVVDDVAAHVFISDILRAPLWLAKIGSVPFASWGWRKATLHTSLVCRAYCILHYYYCATVLSCCQMSNRLGKKILTTVTSIRLSLCLSKSDMSCLVLLSWDSLVYLPRHCLNVALLAHSSCWMKCPGRYWFLLDCYPAQKRRKCSIPTEYNN